MKQSIVKEKSYAFALRVVALYQRLHALKEFDLARQVLRAGTSIGANVEEALAGISRADFAAKMSIASKEARETHYWLRLLRDSKLVPGLPLNDLIQEADELLRILTAIVKTTQLNLKNPKQKNFISTTLDGKRIPGGLNEQHPGDPAGRR
jgi:four helix bundle protein